MDDNENYNEFITETLKDLYFVEWDRFIERENFLGRITKVYGWIERKDNYKDFVVLEFVEHGMDVDLIATSSAKRESEIKDILYGDEYDSSECKRVENRFYVPNAINLDNSIF